MDRRLTTFFDYNEGWPVLWRELWTKRSCDARFYSPWHDAVIRIYDVAATWSRCTSTRAISKTGEQAKQKAATRWSVTAHCELPPALLERTRH